MGVVEKLAFCYSRFSVRESQIGPSFGNLMMSTSTVCYLGRRLCFDSDCHAIGWLAVLSNRLQSEADA